VQEALTNVIKHGRPPSAQVRVSNCADELIVGVVDAGRVPARSLDGGRGLTGMRERVALYNGELAVGPKAGNGFSVRARFPVNDV
jgi:signal transduction histidine kinase